VSVFSTNNVAEMHILGSAASDNWWEWAVHMEDLLLCKGLSDYVSNGDLRLQSVEERTMDRKALALIRSHVSAPLLPYLQGKQSSKVAWDSLQQLHATNLDAKKDLQE
jgi:hypothetical protein